MVGNLVQGNRLASAQGRELGLMDNDDGMRRVSGLVFHAEGQGGLGNELQNKTLLPVFYLCPNPSTFLSLPHSLFLPHLLLITFVLLQHTQFSRT